MDGLTLIDFPEGATERRSQQQASDDLVWIRAVAPGRELHPTAGRRQGGERPFELRDDERGIPIGSQDQHGRPLEGRRLEFPEAVALHQANALDARVAESF